MNDSKFRSALLCLDKTRLWSARISRLVVIRGAKNFTARKNTLPPYKGKGRPPENGDYVRPLARTYHKKGIQRRGSRKKGIQATRPDGNTRPPERNFEMERGPPHDQGAAL